MKKFLFVSVILLIALAHLQFSLPTRQPGPKPKFKWEKLGSRTVNMVADHDEILAGGQGTFTAIKIHVAKANLHVNNIRIVFGNGEDMNIPVNHKFGAGSDSKIIDLPGNKRIINKVILNYVTTPNPMGKAVVTVWGRH